MNDGATWLDQELVQDGNLVTSRGPQDMAAFVPGMLDACASTSAQRATTAGPRASDAGAEGPAA
jgi:protease I